jgi:plasmid stabilization system protein ParE
VTQVYKVRYDPVALDALEETTRYIQEESGPDRAAHWLRAMRTSIQQLEALPHAFSAVCTRQGRPIHSKLILSHRIFYLIDQPTQTVYIIDVVHTARETRLAEYRKPTTE